MLHQHRCQTTQTSAREKYSSLSTPLLFTSTFFKSPMDVNKVIDSIGSAVSNNKEQLKPIVGIAAATSVALYTAYALRKSKSSIPNGLKEVPTVPEGSVPYFGTCIKVIHFASPNMILNRPFTCYGRVTCSQNNRVA